MIIGLCLLNHPGSEFHLITACDPFAMLLDLFCSEFLHQRSFGSKIFFLRDISVCFGDYCKFCFMEMLGRILISSGISLTHTLCLPLYPPSPPLALLAGLPQASDQAGINKKIQTWVLLLSPLYSLSLRHRAYNWLEVVIPGWAPDPLGSWAPWVPTSLAALSMLVAKQL